MTAYFPNFSRFGSFGRPRRNTEAMMPMPPHVLQQQQQREDDEENFVPFIPDSDDEDQPDRHHRYQQQQQQQSQSDDDQAVIPHQLLKIKAYRYRPSKHAWKHALTSGMHTDPDREMALEERKPLCSQLRIITWNVDMVSPHHEERLAAALRHIAEDVLKCKDLDAAPEPCCILLQEVRDSAIQYLLRNEWVRRWFVMTPYTKDKWPEGAHYGTVTLVARSLNIAECHILHFGVSRMHRTGLCVKIKLNHPGTEEKSVISIVNTHLESLLDGAMVRPKQLEMCARFLRLKGVHGGVIAGDMNAITEEDATIGKEAGLRDAWRKGSIDAGKTWGFQGQNEGNFPTNRFDKIYYLPGMGYKVDEPKRIGVGVKIRDGTDEALWVSDHYGLETTLHMLKPRSNSQ